MHNVLDRSLLGRNAVRGPEDQPVDFDLSALVRLVLRQKAMIGSIVAICLVAAIAYVFTATSRYTAESSVVLDAKRLQVVQPANDAPSNPEGIVDSGLVESQVETLKSENIARRVIDKLKLTQDPEFVGEPPGIIGQAIGKVRELLASLRGTEAESQEDADLREALSTFSSNLSVKRQGVSFVATIAYTSEDRRKAARIANAIAEAYIDDKLAFRSDSMRKASAWLDDRIREIRQQASAADRAVEQFKSTNGLIDANGKLVADQQIADLSAQLAGAKSDAAVAQARLDRIAELNRTGYVDAGLTESLKNDVITKLQQQYNDAARREADWSSRYGPNHAAAVALRTEMKQTQKAIQDELRRIGQVYQSEFEIARGREESLRKSLDELFQQTTSTRQQQIKLRELDASAQSYRTLLDTYLQRYVQVVQQESSPITEARIISDALPPKNRSWPKTGIILLGALCGGLFMGLGAAFARERLDTVIRTSEQGERLLGVECLGLLPAITELPASATETLARTASAPPVPGGRPFTVADQTSSYVLHAPFSQFAETLRSVKISATGRGDGCQVLGVISTLPGEGKTTVASNLALLIAQTGSRVLLVDADLRTTSLTARLTPRATTGLLEVLTRRVPLAEAVWQDASTTLKFLPSVTRTTIAHTNEVISSSPMAEMLRQARKDFDYVIMDLPPLAPIVDVRAAARLIDDFVLVVEWGKTPEGVLNRAVTRAPMIHPKLIGFVLNKVDFSAYRRIEGSDGLYYQTRQWERYGYGPS